MHALLTRLLLLPLLSPLLAVLLIAAVNPRPWVALRLLTWTSPAWPLGGWLATGLAVGAGLSAAGTALALQGQPAALQPRRQVRRGADGPEPRTNSIVPASIVHKFVLAFGHCVDVASVWQSSLLADPESGQWATPPHATSRMNI